jgi:hypothetical protein
MNTRIEAALMISAGALLAAAAPLGPTLVERGVSAITRPAPMTTPIEAPVSSGAPDHSGVRVLPCQDSPVAGMSTSNATISTHDDRGGYTVSIVDGGLRKVEVQGGYTLDEDDDTVRILDPDGRVAFETSKASPTIDDLMILRRQYGGPFWNRATPESQAERAALGVGTTPVGPAMAAQLGIERGEVVEFVTPGSGADAGGLRQYDVIMAIDDQPVGERSLAKAIASHKPGETVRVTLIRHGAEQTIPVELGAAPVLAPAFDGFGIDPGELADFQEMRRMLEEQGRRMESRMDTLLPRTPQQPMRYQRMSPAPLLPPAPAPKHDPNTTDASEMAPKSKSRSTPA